MVPPERYAELRERFEGLAAGRPLPMHMPPGLTRYHKRKILRDVDAANRMGWTPSDAHSANGSIDLLTQLGFDTQEYEFGLRLPELLLMRIDRFSMANSVEARVPFLDPKLVEFVYRLPIQCKFREGRGKVVLREAVRDIVPNWVIERRKQGFGAPVLDWLGTDFGALLGTLMKEDSIQQYFDVPTLTKALATKGDRAKRHYGLWPIMNFALWHRHWIEQRPLEPLIEPLVKR
jgi:asparagine synthase (glutamine-hydrolysing)